MGAVWLIPHSSEEFKDFDHLRRWLIGDRGDDLVDDLPSKKGRYDVRTRGGWTTVAPDDICLFQKDAVIVGHAQVSQRFTEEQRADWRSGREYRYEGYMKFDPSTIEIFERPVSVEAANRELGRPNPSSKRLQSRFKQKLTRDEFEKLRVLGAG